MILVRAHILHTPHRALVSIADGALVHANGRILACDDYATVSAAWPNAVIEDHRGSYLVPGFIDTHIHFPQTRIIGSVEKPLLRWLDRVALPEEANMAYTAYAQTIAAEFLASLAANGTTTALVFGSHFVAATDAFFDEAERSGLRIISGLVLSDRNLRPELHQTPDAAYAGATSLIRRHPRLATAVIPRFALSCSGAMLEVARTLLRENPGALFTTHINENPDEVAAVAAAFPEARNYLDVYDRHGLLDSRAVLAHNIHATNPELQRLSQLQAAIAHCPRSNTALESGVFPFHRHLEAGVKVALGTDVGAGTGFDIFGEAQAAAALHNLDFAQTLYLATRAGAEALGLEHETGDLTPGKSADFLLLTFAPAPRIEQVRVAGHIVHPRRSDPRPPP